MATERIYVVAPTTGDAKPRLVRATHPSTAMQHVAKQAFDVRVATQNDIVVLIANGAQVESVRAEQQVLPVEPQQHQPQPE